jgi:hypothetical protein
MMTIQTTKNSQNNVAGIAGFMFLLSLLVPMLNWIFVLSKFILAENAVATSQNILSNEFLFRINITNELIASVIAIVLAVTLYNPQVGKQKFCFACTFPEIDRGHPIGSYCARTLYCFTCPKRSTFFVGN